MKKPKINVTRKAMPDEYLKELQKIARMIHEFRFNFGMLTQKELAENCNLNQNTIQAIESGSENYNLLSLMKILLYFNYDITTFFKEMF